MDEVENPSLPAAGEASPTLRPIPSDDSPTETTKAPPRPGLKRDNSVPPPQQPPPPAPPAQQTLHTPSDDLALQDAPDSLTLADLKRLRTGFPGEAAAQEKPAERKQVLDLTTIYDFHYTDTESFPIELEEWFSYSEEEDARLRRCKAVFTDLWGEGKGEWIEVTEDERRGSVGNLVEGLKAEEREEEEVLRGLMGLVYIGLGVWEETAGRRGGVGGGGEKEERYADNGVQIQWIVAMIDTLRACGGLEAVYSTLRKICEEDFQSTPPVLQNGRGEIQPKRGDESMELWCCLTLMYLFVEVARTTEGDEGKVLKAEIAALEPKLLNYLTQIVARLRWDETAPIPLTKMLLLSWKTILVCFGGIKDVEHVKSTLKEGPEEQDSQGQPVITASPLDYHLFRQEISSKYPAYQPPPPLFPLEPENNTILPPLKHRRASAALSDTSFTSAPNVGAGSIMHQPVHIATPAPSPPPSPAGPGKAGKKQNYQTNQMFPFLYPPLDASSNDLGGKGSTEVQDFLVGKKWEGSDIPTSILEAAELFARRMRATRSMKQLWEVRVEYMKYERGWKSAADLSNKQEDADDFETPARTALNDSAEQNQTIEQTQEQRTLSAVRDYYRDSLPHLQSMVIVLLKAVLQNVTDLVTRGNGQNGLQASIQLNDTNGLNGSMKPLENGNGNGHAETPEDTVEELDKLRGQEIAAKALSAILLLLLKWFKVCHILQYEYLTQLLLDSNYVPLILKLWQTQDIGRACHFHLDRPESNFFAFCLRNSRYGRAAASQPTSDSEDDAAPPPIRTNRPTSTSPTQSNGTDPFPHPPEIDELSYPLTPLPQTPLTSFSHRNTFTFTNHLRTLQKLTRGKTHRALLLVSYKSSLHLKKTLRIPVKELRYYTLKLFKSQVPFCGRKWRQGNMKIITAVYLTIPAELRDDWLTGGGGGFGGNGLGDVDGTVEDALPLEQGMRALTHWWNVRHFAEGMGFEGQEAGKKAEEAEGGFFERELERLEGLGLAGGESEEEVSEEERREIAWGSGGDGY
nr:hypothetical protein B0A51_01272 [Rachicladosporium sp. CCFEE 5018]